MGLQLYGLFPTPDKITLTYGFSWATNLRSHSTPDRYTLAYGLVGTLQLFLPSTLTMAYGLVGYYIYTIYIHVFYFQFLPCYLYSFEHVYSYLLANYNCIADHLL